MFIPPILFPLSFFPIVSTCTFAINWDYNWNIIYDIFKWTDLLSIWFIYALLHLCVCVLCLFLDSVEELCTIDLYEADNRDSHASMHLLLLACKQLHQSGLLNSVLHSQVHTE